MLTAQAATLLRACVQARLSIVFAGHPDAGKTTLLSCTAAELDPGLRVVVAEEVFEADIPLPNVAHMQIRAPASPSRRLVAGFLRMAPDVAIVGEVRDREAFPEIRAPLGWWPAESGLRSANEFYAPSTSGMGRRWNRSWVLGYPPPQGGAPGSTVGFLPGHRATPLAPRSARRIARQALDDTPDMTDVTPVGCRLALNPTVDGRRSGGDNELVATSGWRLTCSCDLGRDHRSEILSERR
jgi:hypothetical protein